MKSILITGASGFIGSFLVERGLEAGMNVWAALRATSSRKYLTDGRTQFIELDLGHDERLRQQLKAHAEQHGPFDYVIHAAGATKCRRPEDFQKTNAEGTLRLALSLLETGALRPEGRFVFLSSLSVCGPVHEIDFEPITENDTPLPNTAYGRSKLQAERYLADVPGLNYVVLRPTGVYGPRERDYFMMAKSIRQHVDFAVGFRPQVLTFIYVADLAEAAYLALDRGPRGAVYPLSDGRQYTSRTFSDLLQLELGVKRVVHLTAPLWVLWLVSCIAGKAAALLGRTSTLNLDKYRIMRQRNWKCSIEAARRDLGYRPQWPLTRGVRAAVEWYKTEGWL
ncbi:MAG: NAD(P)-dependent oxidoreductase [Alloprevotella sp.]|nr:NAD(P)-dependent oxidoreductase [Alloprevotella sp.]